MKKIFAILLLAASHQCINAQRVGIGTTTPNARLAVDSSIMIDQANANDGTLTKSALIFGSDGKAGIVRSFVNGSSGRNGLGFFTNNTRRMTIDSTGQVGIGTINPLATLHVSGTAYVSGSLGLGTSTPDYAFQNLGGYNHMFYGLGVGTVPSSSYLLDVGSTDPSRFRGALQVDGTLTANGNAVVDGTLTVNNGKGVAYNSTSATNLKIFPFTTATFFAILSGHQLSAEGAIAFNGGFTGVPRVFVGDEELSGGTVGELHRVELKLYGCSTTSGTTSCKARLLNTSPNSVNYSITWNCVAIGN